MKTKDLKRFPVIFSLLQKQGMSRKSALNLAQKMWEKRYPNEKNPWLPVSKQSQPYKESEKYKGSAVYKETGSPLVEALLAIRRGVSIEQVSEKYGIPIIQLEELSGKKATPVS